MPSISEIIQKLSVLKETVGDIDVTVYQYAGGEYELCDVVPEYDKEVDVIVLQTTFR